MKKIIIILAVFILSLQLRAQLPAFAYLSGCIIVEKDGVPEAHTVRTNVFPLYHFMRDFNGSADQWKALENMAIAETNKQLSNMGYNTHLQYPVLLSNYDCQAKTQESLDLLNKNAPPAVQITIAAPAGADSMP